MNNEMKSLARYAIEYSKKQGAEGCVCKIANGKSDEFIGENVGLSSINSNEYIGFGITVHYQQKKGTASTNVVNKQSIEDTVNQAISIAKFSVADPFLSLTSLDLAPSAKTLDFLQQDGWDKIKRTTYPKLVEQGLQLLQSNSNIAVDRLSFGVNESDEFYINSNGVEQSEAQSQASWSVLGMAKKDDFVSGMDWESGFCYQPDQIEKGFMTTMDDFSKKIVRLLNRGKASTYTGPLLITPRCVEDLFLDIPLGHLSGRSVMDGRSKFEKDDHGQYFHESITLTDHPHMKNMAGSTSYDLEGIPTKDKTLIQDGKVQGFLYDNYSGKKLGQKPSGLSGGPFVLKLKTGNESLESLLKSNEKLLVIERFSGNSDFTTGMISGVAKSSEFFEKGKSVGIVDETMIAGNIFEMIKNVVGLENKTHTLNNAALYPHILVDGVTVTAS